MIEPKQSAALDDTEWKNNIRERECSCKLMLKRKNYQAHLKDGTHNNRLKGPEPKEAPTNVK